MKTMKCECGNIMVYNEHYACFSCQSCNRCFNIFGQELAPIEVWADEYDNDDY